MVALGYTTWVGSRVPSAWGYFVGMGPAALSALSGKGRANFWGLAPLAPELHIGGYPYLRIRSRGLHSSLDLQYFLPAFSFFSVA